VREVAHDALAEILFSGRSGTPRMNPGACFGKSRPVQTQPGRTCWIESTRLSGYDIGCVEERTREGIRASLLLYNFRVKQA